MTLYDAALCAAFWAGVWRFRGPPASGLRFVVGLALGALAACAGGLLLVPLGLLVVAPWRPEQRTAFLDAALPALPLAFAVAKLGCLAAGCCRAALVEALAFGCVAGALTRVQPDRAAPLSLAGIGAARLALLPLRPGAELSGLLAVLWLLGAALRWPPTRAGDGSCPRPGSAISSRTARSSRSGCAGGSGAAAISR